MSGLIINIIKNVDNEHNASNRNRSDVWLFQGRPSPTAGQFIYVALITGTSVSADLFDIRNEMFMVDLRIIIIIIITITRQFETFALRD